MIRAICFDLVDLGHDNQWGIVNDVHRYLTYGTILPRPVDMFSMIEERTSALNSQNLVQCNVFVAKRPPYLTAGAEKLEQPCPVTLKAFVLFHEPRRTCKSSGRACRHICSSRARTPSKPMIGSGSHSIHV